MPRKVFIIAEAGVNHNGQFKLAKELVDTAKWAGADIVKFQTFSTEENYNPLYANREQIAWAKKLELSKDEFKKLFQYCVDKKIMFLSAAFDAPSVEILDKIGVSAFKVASPEICNFPLLKVIARKGKPIILSTGMAMESEIKDALEVIRTNWNGRGELDKAKNEYSFPPDMISLLYCVSLYPTPYDKVDLKKMVHLGKIFNVPVGFSDHSQGIELAIAAVALGAQIIEKHIKLSEDSECPDALLSLSPDEFRQMVDSIRRVESALGEGTFRISEEEMLSRQRLRKGLVASKDMGKGYVIKESDIELKKPAGEIGLECYSDLIGRVLMKDIRKGELFTYSHINQGT